MTLHDIPSIVAEVKACGSPSVLLALPQTTVDVLTQASKDAQEILKAHNPGDAVFLPELKALDARMGKHLASPPMYACVIAAAYRHYSEGWNDPGSKQSDEISQYFDSMAAEIDAEPSRKGGGVLPYPDAVYGVMLGTLARAEALARAMPQMATGVPIDTRSLRRRARERKGTKEECKSKIEDLKGALSLTAADPDGVSVAGQNTDAGSPQPPDEE